APPGEGTRPTQNKPPGEGPRPEESGFYVGRVPSPGVFFLKRHNAIFNLILCRIFRLIQAPPGEGTRPTQNKPPGEGTRPTQNKPPGEGTRPTRNKKATGASFV
ncbi:MAG: hypothetical protein WCJ40_18590, partial [Planctomycetota bacterium]